MSYHTGKSNPLLTLSNDLRYSFVACDKAAEAYVKALARTMKLTENGGGRNVLVYISEKRPSKPGITLPEKDLDPITCSLVQTDNIDMFYMQVEKIARTVVADVLSRGGALIHGGLCSFSGSGAIMAGPGGVGKTTVSSRLPAPWISHCDDATLVIPDGAGGYNAHPWPTWSRFYLGGPGGAWVVEENIPLRSIFFLKQSETDLVEPLDKYQAKAMLIDTIEHVTRLQRWGNKENNVFISRYIDSAGKIASAVPSYRLHVSLEGEFWKEMESVLPEGAEDEKIKQAVRQLPSKGELEKIHFIYRGTSMNPTLFEPEMLTVMPYKGKNPKKGDIICYRLGQKNNGVVHRIIALKGNSIKTRGDNSASPDDYTVDKSAVIGRVTASIRNDKRRTVYGGHAGLIDMHLQRVSRKINRFVSKLLKKSYYCLSASGVFRKIKPRSMVFKVAIFEKHLRIYPKLVLNGRTVGTFDFRTNTWQIKRPYRLFVDEKKLPLIDDPSLSEL